VRFLFKLYAQGMGGVLSDDMGLGKTLQVLLSKPAVCKCAFCVAVAFGRWLAER
jgi:hypothetical protein